MFKKHDVTAYPETGAELAKRVIKEINDTQAFIITELPDTIEMTLEQYNSMIDQDELEFMSEYSELLDQVKQSENKMFRVPDAKHPNGSPICVMEVRIKGGDYATKTPEGNNILEIG